MWRQNDPLKSWSRAPRPLAERFWEKVEIRNSDDCWLWRGALSSHGYGNLGSGDGKTLRAHCVSFELAYGGLPPGCVICHRCDSPACVNPNHLYAASQAANLGDMAAKGRSAHGERSAAARLSESAVLTIRSSARKQIDLAKQLGVSPMTISYAKRRLAWRHLP